MLVALGAARRRGHGPRPSSRGCGLAPPRQRPSALLAAGTGGGRAVSRGRRAEAAATTATTRAGLGSLPQGRRRPRCTDRRRHLAGPPDQSETASRKSGRPRPAEAARAERTGAPLRGSRSPVCWGERSKGRRSQGGAAPQPLRLGKRTKRRTRTATRALSAAPRRSGATTRALNAAPRLSDSAAVALRTPPSALARRQGRGRSIGPAHPTRMVPRKKTERLEAAAQRRRQRRLRQRRPRACRSGGEPPRPPRAPGQRLPGPSLRFRERRPRLLQRRAPERRRACSRRGPRSAPRTRQGKTAQKTAVRCGHARGPRLVPPRTLLEKAPRPSAWRPPGTRRRSTLRRRAPRPPLPMRGPARPQSPTRRTRRSAAGARRRRRRPGGSSSPRGRARWRQRPRASARPTSGPGGGARRRRPRGGRRRRSRVARGARSRRRPTAARPPKPEGRLRRLGSQRLRRLLLLAGPPPSPTQAQRRAASPTGGQTGSSRRGAGRRRPTMRAAPMRTRRLRSRRRRLGHLPVPGRASLLLPPGPPEAHLLHLHRSRDCSRATRRRPRRRRRRRARRAAGATKSPA